ncbi:hypothetical protein DY000_02044676 [Brassica cretica]|uniref:Malectin domain-containing protein n=1 Tax=Brassica cretica TaxID=69181 RepID=A0ABQ7EVN5_BRACR|nr:hypothetical protein DY000_02044676 [Brassica cretica]
MLTAKVSHSSLTYYGLCLVNGNYTVHLHFAEIIFTDDKTLYSLGSNTCSIFILRNFNIQEAAGGSDNGVSLLVSDFKPPVYHDKKEIILKEGISNIYKLWRLARSLEGPCGLRSFLSLVAQSALSLIPVPRPTFRSRLLASVHGERLVLGVSFGAKGACTGGWGDFQKTVQLVSLLEGKTAMQELLSDSSFSTVINPKLKGLRNHFWQNELSRTLSFPTRGHLLSIHNLMLWSRLNYWIN